MTTTVTLHAGTVTALGSASGGVTGSGAVWDDASDSTYLESTGFDSSGQSMLGTAPLDVLSLPSGATVTAVTVNLRAESLSGSDSPSRLGVAVYQGGSTFPPFDASYQVGVTDNPSFGGGWLVEDASPTDHAHTFDSTDFSGWSTSLSALASALAAGAKFYVYTLTNSFHSGSVVAHRIYEVSVDVTVDDGSVDLPCDTTVEMDLSSATFTGLDAGGPFGQYGDSVIYTNFPGFPDFYIGGLDVDSTSRYRVTMSYAPGSAHDAGGRGFSITGVIPGHEDDPNTVGGFPIGDLYDGSGNTADSVTVTIGPGINGWDDPTYGVAAGYTRLWFETDRDGALSAISVRKICTSFAPPLRLTNRDDMFASARRVSGSTSRQGSLRLTGYL